MRITVLVAGAVLLTGINGVAQEADLAPTSGGVKILVDVLKGLISKAGRDPIIECADYKKLRGPDVVCGEFDETKLTAPGYYWQLDLAHPLPYGSHGMCSEEEEAGKPPLACNDKTANTPAGHGQVHRHIGVGTSSEVRTKWVRNLSKEAGGRKKYQGQEPIGHCPHEKDQAPPADPTAPYAVYTATCRAISPIRTEEIARLKNWFCAYGRQTLIDLKFVSEQELWCGK